MELRAWGQLDLDSKPASKSYRGITIGAIQESLDGTWEWVWVEDVPNDAPIQAEDYPRLALSSMTAYYPESRDPGFLSAFIPFVDYMQHISQGYAIGGQCSLVRVQRSEVGAAWSFGPVKEIVSSWGISQEHPGILSVWALMVYMIVKISISMPSN